jgi:hypothetical protein
MFLQELARFETESSEAEALVKDLRLQLADKDRKLSDQAKRAGKLNRTRAEERQRIQASHNEQLANKDQVGRF